MVKACGEWVVVQPVEDSATAGKKDIIIPDAVKESMQNSKDSDFAVVISAGDKVQGIEEGDVVLLLLGSCLRLPPLDEGLFLCSRADRVICVVDKQGAGKKKG